MDEIRGNMSWIDTTGFAMNETQPASYPHRILLAVTGLSPQVVTETLFALAVTDDGMAPFVPTEIHIITTAEGAERARLALLHEESGWFHRLRHDYALAPIQFDHTRIHMLESSSGEPLSDIRSKEDNECAANLITETVRSLTVQNDSTLHVSIAGGRKTMGFYVAYALSLYGRPQDRLSHVLVSAPYESHPEFFYPTPHSKVIHSFPPDSRPYDAKDATITLAEIPFVRLREGIPESLLEGRTPYSDVVTAAQRVTGPLSLLVDYLNGQVVAGGAEVPMSPAELAFYGMLARRALKQQDALHSSDRDLEELFLNEYVPLVGDEYSGYVKKVRERLQADFRAWFEERKARCNSALRKELGEVAARPYQIESFGGKPKTGAGLTVPVERIEIREISNE